MQLKHYGPTLSQPAQSPLSTACSPYSILPVIGHHFVPPVISNPRSLPNTQCTTNIWGFRALVWSSFPPSNSEDLSFFEFCFHQLFTVSPTLFLPIWVFWVFWPFEPTQHTTSSTTNYPTVQLVNNLIDEMTKLANWLIDALTNCLIDLLAVTNWFTGWLTK